MESTVLFLFIGIIIVGGAFLALVTLTKKPSKHLDQSKYRERWLGISNSITSDMGSQQFAIMNADKLLDQALRERGIPGETMGDRLKNAKHLFHDNNAVWTAHKLRNRIAHEDNVRGVNPLVTRKAMSSLKSALKDLGAL